MGAALSGGYSSQSSTDVLTQLIHSLTQSNSTQQSNATTQAGSSTARTLLPGQAGLIGPTSSFIQNALTNPSQYVAPTQNQAREQVNDNYSGLADKLHQQFLSLGGGSSGKFGSSLVKGDIARRGELSNVDNQAAVSAAQVPFSAANLAKQMLDLNFGQSSTSSGSSDASGSAANTTTEDQTTNGTEKKTGSGFNIGATVGAGGSLFPLKPSGG